MTDRYRDEWQESEAELLRASGRDAEKLIGRLQAGEVPQEEVLDWLKTFAKAVQRLRRSVEEEGKE